MSARKRFRRFATVTVLLILLVVLAFLGYVTYQQHDSYQTLIPKSTNALVRVDVYAMYRSMLGEAFGSKKKSGKHRLKGVAIPANIFCYSVSGKQRGTWFTSLPISNMEQWEASLGEMPELTRKHEQSGVHVVSSKDNRWTIAYDKTHIAIAFSSAKEPVEDQLQKILKQQDMVAVSKSDFHAISEQDGHITFLSGKNAGTIAFETGAITAQLTLDAAGFNIPDKVAHQQVDSKAAVNLWLFADFEPLLKGKTFAIDTFSIHGDSILSSQPKGLELLITEPLVQRDSMVRYEYNDDFEKVATATVKEQSVPGMYLRLYAAYNVLDTYLQRSHIVIADSQLVNRAAFPLYQLHTMQLTNAMQFSTVKQPPTMPPLVSGNDFMGLMINFDRLRQQEPFAYISPYTRPFRQLHLTGSRQGKGSIIIHSRLSLMEVSRSSLAQLLDYL